MAILQRSCRSRSRSSQNAFQNSDPRSTGRLSSHPECQHNSFRMGFPKEQILQLAHIKHSLIFHAANFDDSKLNYYFAIFIFEKLKSVLRREVLIKQT